MAATYQELRPTLASLRAWGFSEAECLDHSPSWLQEQQTALGERVQAEHKQHLASLLVGVHLATAAAMGSEEAGRRYSELLEELTRAADEDDWFLDPKAKGYDLAAVRGFQQGVSQSGARVD